MDNFIAYLDTYKEFDYFDAASFFNATNAHYIHNNLGDIAYTGLKGYELWQSSHMADISFPVEKKQQPQQNKTIDISANTISDLIKVIDDNQCEVDTKYNFDLKALHKIRTELVELNDMIGMNTLKASVFNQLIYFIQDLHVDSKNKTSDFKHTIICGPPGTGKTEVAKIIGRMYSKVGILKKDIFK